MIELLTSRLKKCRPVGLGRWMACCPAHDDKTPSMTITESGGKILFHCFAGCSPDEILDSLDLKWTDLYPDEWEAAEQRAYSQKLPLPPVDTLRVEENVLLITKQMIEDGKKLTPEDEARALVALERIQEARSEC